jgi:hypothetical protein
MIKDIELLIDELLKKRDDLNLVYGGAKIGVMGVVAEKFLNDNRKVYGVMPSFLKKREVDHRSLSEFIETESMHERKQIMYDKSDAFLVLPGGFGTLDELFETACWSQLDQHRKPICVFNPRGFYKHLEAMINSMLDSGFISNDDKEIINIESNISNVYNSLV